VRIEHHGGVGRADLELLAQPALRALAEQRAPHPVGDPGTAAPRGADVDRVETFDGGFAVEAMGTLPLARRVGEAMLRGGWPVVELRQDTLDLEDIFLELVRSGAA
jgi:hypothetical protein